MINHLNDATDSKKYGLRAARHGSFTKLIILSEIARSEPSGCGVHDIAECTGIHRTTVSRHCDDLVGLDYITKQNKLASYHLTDKVYGDPKIRSYLFRKTIMDKILKLQLSVAHPNKFSVVKLKKELFDIPEDYLEELELFEFSNKIGAIITKICIDAVSPVASIKLMDTTFDSNKVPLLGKQKDKHSLELVRDAISQLSIFEQFCELRIVKRGHAIYKHIPIKSKEAMSHGHWGPGVKTKQQENEAYQKYVEVMNEAFSNYSEFDPKDRKWSRYRMDSKNFSKLNDRFNSVFPELSIELKKLEKDIEKNIQQEKESMYSYQESEKLKLKIDPDHSICDGDLKPVFFDKSGKTKICTKCHRYFKTIKD